MCDENDLASVTLQFARVYGSDDYFGSEPHTAPAGSPLTYRDCPKTGDRLSLILGSSPELIFRAQDVTWAVGQLMLMSLVGREAQEGVSADARIERFLAERKRPPTITEVNWYVTITVDRDVSVDAARLGEGRYYWLEPGIATKLTDEFRREISPVADVLAIHASTIIGSGFLEKELISDAVYFRRPGREVFALPNIQCTGLAAHIRRDMASLDLDQLSSVISAAATSPRQRHDWLGAIKYWYLAALKEPDEWKRFEYFFLVLEILARRLAKLLYNEPHHLLPAGDDVEACDGPLSLEELGLLPPLERLSLRQAFAIAVLGLYPREAEGLIRTFADVKKARDQLSHGGLRTGARLPVSKARALADKCIKGAICRFTLP